MKKLGLFLLLFGFFVFNSCSMKNKCDLIVYNASIYTVDSNFSKAECFAVADGKFVAVGRNDVVLNDYESENIVDAHGKFIYPGFIDAHCHFYGYGLSLMRADLIDTRSFDEVIKRVTEHQKKYSPAWILGRGWDQNDWTVKAFPTKEKLDILFPDIPVYLTRIDGHAALTNSKALQLAGITIKTRVPGGSIEVDSSGALTGILIDNAMELVEKIIPEPDNKEKRLALKNAASNCFKVGLTSVGDAGLNKDIVLLIDSMQNAGQLKMKIYAMLNPTIENIEYFVKKSAFITPFLTVRSIKLFADGALGSRGACLKKPYCDSPGNNGLIVTSADSIRELCKMVLKYGYQVNTHAIGDSAVCMVLDIYSEFLKGKNDLRWRIEHSQVVSKEDMKKYGKYAIIPAVNTTHATSDMNWAGQRLGLIRLKTAYAYKDLLNQNGWLCNGSDFPVENINPLRGFYAAVFRKDISGNPEKGFMSENSLSRIQALKAMTIWAARSFFEEKSRGSIEPGKSADFVVLNKDIMKTTDKEIVSIKVVNTYINGVLVYDISKSY